MYCRKCGKQLPDKSRFCDACGTSVGVSLSSEPASVVAVGAAATHQPVAEIAEVSVGVAKRSVETTGAEAETQAPTLAPVSDVSPKLRLAAALLAFFVGGFGAHRFYLGRKGTAVVMLVLTVIGIVIAIATEDISGFVFLPILALGRAVRFGPGFIPVAAVGIWAFVDFIVILCGRMRDGKGRRVKNWR